MKIDITNYEAFLLLYIDNELSATQKAAVNLFLQENPIYLKELSLLQQAVLKPEAIAYEDKALLYRFEEMEAILPNEFKQNLYQKEAPVVKGFFTNKRIPAISAVAAILLLMIGYRFAIKVPELAQLNTVSAPSNIAQSNGNHSANLLTPLVAISTAKNQQPKNLGTKSIQEKEENNNQVANLSTEALAIITPETSSTSVTNIEKNEHIDASQKINIPVITTNSIAVAEPSESFEELNTENPDRVIYVANFEIDGDKLRGLTRRVSALLRRNKTEKEK